MRYVVEVANERGNKATKEYEAKTSDELRTKIAKEGLTILSWHPHC
jgi:type II secretory pathway component PulF